MSLNVAQTKHLCWQDNTILSTAVRVKIFIHKCLKCMFVSIVVKRLGLTQCNCYDAPRGFAAEFMCVLL